jgi:nucleotide-binding universal stress UspA family protein/hemerythrin-like domain-containing protein
MYRHLLVPVDGTELSTANADEAIRLAAALLARITFVHVVPDYGATSDGALVLTLDPSAFAERSRGDAPALLAKACAAAAAAGVHCDTHTTVGNRPAEAIVETALRCQCDLIVMASHGASGVQALLAPSQTRRVLHQSPVALLVTRVQANDPQPHANRAIALIHDEHRSLAAVIRGMQQVIDEARQGAPLDRATLQQMVRYVHAFPEQLHHPKEEKSLHPPLLRARPEAAALLQRLEAEHRHERVLVQRVEAALDVCIPTTTGDDARLATLQQAVEDLARAVWAHLDTEERQLMPLARDALSEAEWAVVADDFASHQAVTLGELSPQAFRRLFASIAAMLHLPVASTAA